MTWTTIATVPSSSDVTRTYEIKRHPETGTIGCTCLGWRFSRSNPRTCRHLAQFLARALDEWNATLVASELPLTPNTYDADDELVRSITL